MTAFKAGDPSRRVRFDTFEADLRSGELWNRGVKVKVGEQPFSVLAVLLRQPGDVVTREALQRELWPADTFVDFDRGLNKAINRLREALGDSADDPRHIETLPKRGYRFIAVIEPVSTPTVPPRGETSNIARWLKRLAVPAAIVAVAGISVSVAFLSRSRKQVNVVRASVLPPEAMSFVPHQFVLSPDGTHLAFSAADAEGTTALWVRPLSSAAARRLDGTAGAAYPFSSPDSRRIGFFAD